MDVRHDGRGTSRRTFLGALGGASVVSRLAADNAGIDLQGFRGSAAGDERVVNGIRLCWCPPGRFVMGSPVSEPDRRDDEAQAEVTLTRGFWMARFETTQGQWKRVSSAFPDRPPSAAFGLGDDVPVYWVNYFEAEDFCTRLTLMAQQAGTLPGDWRFRLPTEAQWEYACRAGTTTATAFGAAIGREHANFLGSASSADDRTPPVRKAVPVGRYRPNAWGLCDMHGNIFEWCRDWYHDRLPGGVDPDLSDVRGVPNRDGSYSRCRRGGAWNDSSVFIRSACRLRYEPDRRSDHIGFRVVAVEQ